MPDKTGKSNSINYALKRGYATLTTDGGHQTGNIIDASWALNNIQAQEIYAHKGIKLSYDAGIKIVEALYGKAPEYRYFSGCSNGGRMAAMAAQRYPTLFNGIIAGCGVMDISSSGGIFGAWILQTNIDEEGEVILGPDFAAKLPFLAHEARKQCDANDGNKDGLISKPETCDIDVGLMPKCDGSGGSDCLTPAEARVVADWYQGPQDSNGKQLFSGMPPGSERYWAIWRLGKAQAADPNESLAGGYLRFLAFPTVLPTSIQ